MDIMNQQKQAVIITCPSCGHTVSLEGIARHCPICGASLEIIEADHNFALLGVREEPVTVKEEDTLIDFYERWRAGSVFIMLLGVVVFFFVFFDIKNSYINYGPYFWKSGENLFFPLVAGFVGFLFLVIGYILFRYFGKQRDALRSLSKEAGEEK